MARVEGSINKNIDEKLAEVNAGMEKLTHDSRRMESRQNSVNKNLEERMQRMETNMQRLQYQRMTSHTVGKESSKPPQFQLDGRAARKSADRSKDKLAAVPTPPLDKETEDLEDDRQAEGLTRQMSWADEVEAVVNSKDKSNDDIDREILMRQKQNDRDQWINKKRSTWAEDLEADLKKDGDRPRSPTSRRLDRRKNEDTEVVKEHKTCREEKVMINVVHWFGECEADSDESSEEDENEDLDDWELVERKKKNQRKRRKAAIKKQRKQEEIAEKAQRMVGIGPILDGDISKHMKDTKDYSKAKVWAIKEHLAINYKYNQEELDKISIVETKRSHKGDNIIYLAMLDKGDIRDIYARKAECKADKTTVKNFIPPQFYDKFMALNKLCAGRRSEDSQLKTQIRFNNRDLEVLVKVKGGEDPYKTVDLKKFAAGGHIPSFDNTIKWRWQEDRQPRRRVMSEDALPAGRKEWGEKPARPVQQKSVNPVYKYTLDNTQPGSSLTRVNSGSDSTDLPPKKLRRQVEEVEVEAVDPLESDNMNLADETL